MFEYGGQVTGVDSQTAIAAMRQAGMTWMKLQVVYRPGNDPAAIGGLIQTAKGNGFKILISALGTPEDLAAGGGGYIQGFAGYLSGIASYGPDAIEVWNEANISREWPVGQISGADYAAMLGNAYAAIKGASPGTMVISAAPAPTGGESAFPAGHVRNDDAWLTNSCRLAARSMPTVSASTIMRASFRRPRPAVTRATNSIRAISDRWSTCMPR